MRRTQRSGNLRERQRRRRASRLVLGSRPAAVPAGTPARQPQIRVLAYGADGCEQRVLDDVAAVAALLNRWPVIWVDVDGVSDARLVADLGLLFGLHALALEDVMNLQQRAKLEHYDAHDYVVARMVSLDRGVETEQISLFFGRNFVVTFQAGTPGDCLEAVRERIRKAGGRIRRSGADYLAYSLLDAIIDGYFPVLEALGERLEALEDEVLTRPARDAVARIHDSKRDLLTLRRAIWPLREALNSLIRDANPLVTDETRLHLRDCYDHAVRIIDLTETCRELGSDLMDLYLSSLSQRLNETMKILAIFSTIFIPLNLVAGIYGMNFDGQASPVNMPELRWYYGYPFALSLMVLIAAVLIGWFWRRGWFEPGPGRSETADGRGA